MLGRQPSLVMALGLAAVSAAPGVTLHVATTGNDANPGTVDAPLATLTGARDAARRVKADGPPAGGITVEVHRGAYEMTAPLALTAEDSGTAESPIVYRAVEGDEVRLIGGAVVKSWQGVEDAAVLDRLEPTAAAHVLQADLSALGITDYGPPSGGGLELFFQNRPMLLARWPNEGFVKVGETVGGEVYDIRGRKGDKIGKFTYDYDRPQRWVAEKDLWLHGYWFWDWSDQRHAVESIDLENRVIAVKPPYHHYGYRQGMYYYAFNALSEIDQPEEWYLDRETGILTFLPPAPIEQGEAIVSVAPTLVTMQDVSNVTLRGFTLEACRSTAVTISGGADNQIVGCAIRNVGGNGVSISGGLRHGVIGCDIYQIADSGVILSGGDRITLTPAEHYADNNHIHDYGRFKRMYSRGVALGGVGNRATHNLIHHAPHQAISFGGNDHLMELNEIHSVCTESNDAGAIYSGRDWTQRGTIIRHNYMHHIAGYENKGCVGVYLDDMFCGTEISGNVFYKVRRAAFIGGGRDNLVLNNIFVDCAPAVHCDARAMGWAGYHVATTMKDRLDAMPTTTPPWSERYPELLTLWGDEPAAPKGNVIARNVSVGGKFDGIQNQARPYQTIEDNLVDQDPHFVDRENGDYRLREDSPAFALGFAPLPIESIGLYDDERRASWPVESTPIEVVMPK